MYNCLAIHLLHKLQTKPQPVRSYGWTIFSNPNPQRTPERARLERVK